ncbi:unnamed protein product [marine sediment metagenome]|uniref:Uncharacterized protein n=1 Tax=marine sediment metagenome TaxID=412755 RepID=X1BYF9_9ZZZZ
MNDTDIHSPISKGSKRKDEEEYILYESLASMVRLTKLTTIGMRYTLLIETIREL